jgi:hypothetical protein
MRSRWFPISEYVNNFCAQLLILVLVRQLLANLWARHAALQCSFNQESLDLLIPHYTGSVAPGEIFDPAALSGTIVQIKFRSGSDGNAELAPRPIGLPRDTVEPLPYLALYLELGNESSYKATNTKIKVTASEPTTLGRFKGLSDDCFHAAMKLATYRRRSKKKKATLEKRKKDVQEKRLAMDLYNRYSISVRGASANVYGILKTVDIAQEFDLLLSVTMPSPPDHEPMLQQMRPLERVGNTSAHTAWMSQYVADTDDDMEGTGDDMEGTGDDMEGTGDDMEGTGDGA